MGESSVNIKTKEKETCISPYCFFCTMKEPDSSLKRAKLSNIFHQIPLKDDEENVLILSSLWNIAMTQPNDPMFLSLGILTCMSRLIQKSINNPEFLLRHQNIYIPYYAAHIIGSYTIKRADFAEKVVQSGLIPPLIGLLRGKISWVEQRVAVRALGHLASYDSTFEAVAAYEEEIVELTMKLASTCLDVVYVNFVRVKDKNNRRTRLKYQSDLLTRGVGAVELENRKAEEWASQIQCWSIHLLNCFASKERSLDLICRKDFLKELSYMWGGLVNDTSPCGIGLIRILCYSKKGRKYVAESEDVIENLCNLSRSSDDWQYMGVDCLLLLLKDIDTKYKVMAKAAAFLVDLIELNSLSDRRNLGEGITKTLLLGYEQTKQKLKNKNLEKLLDEVWEIKVERRKREKMLSGEKMRERKILVGLIKQEAKNMLMVGDVAGAIKKYSEGLEVCPLKLRKERMVLYSNRAECYLLMRDPDSAIRDATRGLCLSDPVNTHGKSLWRRAQGYDMEGLAKESLMDCVMFINVCGRNENKRVKVPYYAARMVCKHMDATWLFAKARLKYDMVSSQVSNDMQGCTDNKEEQEWDIDEILRIILEKKSIVSGQYNETSQGLSTIVEEPIVSKGKGSKRFSSPKSRSSRNTLAARSY